MTTQLTEEELGWLDGVFGQVNEELNQRLCELGQVPLSYLPTSLPSTSSVEAHTERSTRLLRAHAHAEDFIALEALGRCRLSKETRKAEAKRLKRKYKLRKKYTFRYGRKHNKAKAKTRKEYNNRRWEKAPLERLRYTSRKPVSISQEEWDRWIAPVWERYDRKYLKLRCSSPKMTVCTLVIEYHAPKARYSHKTPKPVVVYNGYDTAVYMAMSPEGE